MQNTFKAKNLHQNMTTWFLANIPLGKFYACKNQCTDQMRTYIFKSILHDDAKTWANAGTLKVKYLVNAVNFICILLSDPLII